MGKVQTPFAIIGDDTLVLFKRLFWRSDLTCRGDA